MCIVHLYRPHVVNVLWLLACCTSGERVEEQQYICLDPSLPSDGGREEEEERGREGKGGRGKRKRRLEEEGGREDKGRLDGKKPCVDRKQEDGYETTCMTDEEALLLQYQNGELSL